MKKYFKSVIALFVMILGVLSCSNSKVSNEGGSSDKLDDKKGFVSFNLKSNDAFSTITRAGEAVNTDDFTVVIYNSSNQVVEKWNNFKDMPQMVSLLAGDYSVEAYSGILQAAAFEVPYYYGKKDFSVIFEETRSIELTCSIRNMKVTVDYSNFFLSNFDSFSVKVQIKDNSVVPQGHDSELVFGKDVTAAGYYMVTPLVILIEGVKTGGARFTHTEEITDVHPRDWHKITLSANPMGNGSFIISVNTETINIDHEINVPTDDEDLGLGGDTTEPDPGEGGGGEVDPPAGDVLPTVIGDGFNIDEELVISDSDIVDGVCTKNVKISISAEEDGIQNLIVKIAMSDSGLQDIVNSMFGGDSFDLANLTVETKATLVQLGLISENQPIKGEKSFQVNLTPFMGLLAGGVSEFTVKVVDGKGNTTEKALSVNRKSAN